MFFVVGIQKSVDQTRLKLTETAPPRIDFAHCGMPVTGDYMGLVPVRGGGKKIEDLTEQFAIA